MTGFCVASHPCRSPRRLRVKDGALAGWLGQGWGTRLQTHNSKRWPMHRSRGTGERIRSHGSAGAGQNDGDVIWLFGAANPLCHGIRNGQTDARERLVAMLLNQGNQAFLAELA